MFLLDFPLFSSVLELREPAAFETIARHTTDETYARMLEKRGKSSEITPFFDVLEHVSQNVINISARSDCHPMRKSTENQNPMTVFPNV